MPSKKSPSEIIDEAIALAERLEEFAINNYSWPIDLERGESIMQLIHWSYAARLARGDNKAQVLARFDKIAEQLKRAKTRKVF